jgi:hypothetical protein
VELLVAAQGVPGGSADLRGMVLKDFSSNMGSDLGGKFIFSNSIVWQSVKAGTLIVLASSNTTEDLVAPDFVLRANLLNPDLFTPAGGGFDIAASDMVLIKAAGTGADGVAGGIHALSVGSAGAQYANFNGRKLNFSRSLNSNRPFVFAVNDSSSLADFYSNSGADISRSLQFGSGNNAKNTTFITSLQTANASNTQPVITLNGTTPMTIAHGTVYSEPGATANDLEDGPLPVAISGSVNAMVVGTYTITYRASDSGNLTTTVDRIVNVTDQTPPVVTLIGNATLELPFGGNFTDPGATANDAVDGNRTVNVSGTVNRFAAGSYILAYRLRGQYLARRHANGGRGEGSSRNFPGAIGLGDRLWLRALRLHTRRRQCQRRRQFLLDRSHHHPAARHRQFLRHLHARRFRQLHHRQHHRHPHRHSYAHRIRILGRVERTRGPERRRKRRPRCRWFHKRPGIRLRSRSLNPRRKIVGDRARRKCPREDHLPPARWHDLHRSTRERPRRRLQSNPANLDFREHIECSRRLHPPRSAAP